MWRKPSVIALGLGMLAFVAVTARPNHGLATPMLTLTSSGGGVYDYGVTVGAGESVTFDQHQTITLSGLSGVTGASVTPEFSIFFTVTGFTSTSAVFAQAKFGTSTFPGPFTYGNLVVDSSVLTVGTVDFTMETSAGTITGTVPGPVSAAIPEPASLSLFGAAVLGLGWFGRRRRQSA